ncbi:threonine/serine exporter family protein [Salana multivorans]
MGEGDLSGGESSGTQLGLADGQQRIRLLSLLGYGFLESGQTSGQTARILVACGRALGLRDLSFNIFGRIVLLEASLPDRSVVTSSGAADSLDAIDCTKSRELNQVAEEITTQRWDASPEQERSTLDQMRERIGQLRRSVTPPWITILGMTVLAFCISVQLPISWQGRFATALTQLIVSLTATGLSRWPGLPKLFWAGLLSLVSGTVVTILVLIGLVVPADGTAAIAVTCLLILPLPQVIGSVADAIEGDLLSALGRLAAVVVAGAGIVIGQAITYYYGELFGMEHPDLSALAGLPTPPWYLILVFCALGAMANAFANGGRPRLLGPAAVIGAITGATNQLLSNTDWGLGMSPLWASSLSGVALGLLTIFFVLRTGYPQQVLALMGFTGALLPGMQIFQGIMNLMGEVDARINAVPSFLTAGSMCIGVGIGVSLGAYLANGALAVLKASQTQARQEREPPVELRRIL